MSRWSTSTPEGGTLELARLEAKVAVGLDLDWTTRSRLAHFQFHHQEVVGGHVIHHTNA